MYTEKDDEKDWNDKNGLLKFGRLACSLGWTGLTANAGSASTHRRGNLHCPTWQWSRNQVLVLVLVPELVLMVMELAM